MIIGKFEDIDKHVTKNKGFTLIEILAIIVVLAVIALIATPIISNIINDVKLNAFKTKIYALENAAETYYEEVIEEDEESFIKGLDGTYTLTIDLSDKEQTKKLDIKTFNKGLLTITEEGKISITAIEDKYCGQKLHSSSVINMLDINNDFTCYLLNSSSSNLGTQDILTAIQNLKNDVEDLKKENETLSKSNEELKESIKNLSDKSIGSTQALNKIYPIGSIYTSTTLDTIEKVKEALGGEWESYGDGRVLRSTTTKSEQTGGSSTVSLTTANLPSHSHSYTPVGSITSTFKGSAVNTGSTGSGYNINYTYANRTTTTSGDHYHKLLSYGTDFVVPSGIGKGHSFVPDGSGTQSGAEWFTSSYITSETGSHTHTYPDFFVNSISGVDAHTHTVTAKGTVSSTFKGTTSNTSTVGSNTAFSVLDPYITVYMYKRVK